LIVCSIFILSGGLEIFRKKDIKTTVFYGGYVGLIIASYTLVDKGAMTVVKLSPILFYYLVTAGQFLVLLPYAWKNRKHLKGEWHASKFHAIGVGVLNPLAYISVLVVMTFIPVSHVAPVREMSILIGT